MIQVTDRIAIDDRDIQLKFVRASGPGGQNINRVATAVQLRFDVTHASCLPDDVRKRLIRMAGTRINEQGVLVIHARRFRTQGRNRRDAIDRLKELIRKAAEKPKRRIRTKPSAESKKRRLEGKRRRGMLKQARGRVRGPDED